MDLRNGTFAFGNNWRSFLKVVDEERIAQAERSLKEMLGIESLSGRSFIDIGCGSGLFSLAAARLGARVHSVDPDEGCVQCAQELKTRFLDSGDWTIERGSVLDNRYLASLGKFDVVYSWGVLHHTGDMWRSMEEVATLVADDGLLFISIYNDQGKASRIWSKIKATYNAMPTFARPMLVLAVGLFFEVRSSVARALNGQNPLPFATWAERKAKRKATRGMSLWHDLVDWVGGYPFEVAKPEQIFDFYKKRGLHLMRLKTCAGGLGCNEFVFRK